MTKFVDVEMTDYSNENELHIKEEIDITTEEYDQEQIDHALTCDVVVKEEGSVSSCGDPELEVLRVESPKLTTRLQRLIARTAQKPVSRKRVRKAKKSKPKRKPPPPPSTADGGDEKDSPSEEQIVGCPNRNQFCYICGFFTPPNNARNLTTNLITAYEEYFLVAYAPNLGFVPDLACDYCYRCLMGWKNGSERHKMKYVRPVTWKPQNEHIVEQCYFCLTKTTGFRYSTREKISYPNVTMFTKAQIRSEQYPTANSEEVARKEQTLTVAEEISTTDTIKETTNVDKSSPIEKGLAPSVEEISVDTEENPLVDKIKTIESSVMTTSKEETPIIEDVTPQS